MAKTQPETCIRRSIKDALTFAGWDVTTHLQGVGCRRGFPDLTAMKDGRTLILASASPRRRELLGQMGLEFEVVPSGADEHVTETDPERKVELLAERKAEEVFERIRREKPEMHPDGKQPCRRESRGLRKRNG